MPDKGSSQRNQQSGVEKGALIKKARAVRSTTVQWTGLSKGEAWSLLKIDGDLGDIGISLTLDPVSLVVLLLAPVFAQRWLFWGAAASMTWELAFLLWVHRSGRYRGVAGIKAELSLLQPLLRVGFYLLYQAGLVSAPRVHCTCEPVSKTLVRRDYSATASVHSVVTKNHEILYSTCCAYRCTCGECEQWTQPGTYFSAMNVNHSLQVYHYHYTPDTTPLICMNAKMGYTVVVVDPPNITRTLPTFSEDCCFCLPDWVTPRLWSPVGLNVKVYFDTSANPRGI
jgi:hypothetical protein